MTAPLIKTGATFPGLKAKQALGILLFATSKVLTRMWINPMEAHSDRRGQFPSPGRNIFGQCRVNRRNRQRFSKHKSLQAAKQN